MNVIETKDLVKYYKSGGVKVKVIKDISLKIENGEFISIIGPSGSGKSTLLYLLSGMENISSGEVLLLGKDLKTITDKEKSEFRNSKIGFVFQFYNLIAEISVEDNILLPNLISKEKINYDRLDKILELVSLSDHRKKLPNELSGGQQQRVAIARAFYVNPQIIFADEPTGNLDSKTGKEIMELFKKINDEYGTTIVQVTHNIKHTLYSSRIIKLVDGELDDDKRIN